MQTMPKEPKKLTELQHLEGACELVQSRSFSVLNDLLVRSISQEMLPSLEARYFTSLGDEGYVWAVLQDEALVCFQEGDLCLVSMATLEIVL
jgi:hypothetical protein